SIELRLQAGLCVQFQVESEEKMSAGDDVSGGGDIDEFDSAGGDRLVRHAPRRTINSAMPSVTPLTTPVTTQRPRVHGNVARVLNRIMEGVRESNASVNRNSPPQTVTIDTPNIDSQSQFHFDIEEKKHRDREEKFQDEVHVNPHHNVNDNIARSIEPSS